MRKAYFYSLVLVDVIAFHAPSVWLLFFLLYPKEGQGGAWDAAFNALLIIVWGGLHSLMARTFARDLIAKWVGENFFKLVYTVIAGIAQSLMLYYWRPLHGTLWRAQGAHYWVLTFLFLCTFGLVFYSSLLLDYMEVLGVRGIMRRYRKEQPKPLSLCLRGPYRHCRHPAYLATLASLWIGPVMTYGRLEFAVLGTMYVLIGTLLEERDMRRILGATYDHYCAHVPRWLPRLTPWRAGSYPDV